jgi:hypothetical protein
MGKLLMLHYRGAYRTAYYYLKENGDNPVLDFIMDLHQKRPKECTKLRNNIQKVCELQRPNTEVFHYQGDKIYYIKDHQARIFSFMDGSDIIMCHANIKKRDRTVRSDIDKVKVLRKEYERRKGTHR